MTLSETDLRVLAFLRGLRSPQAGAAVIGDRCFRTAGASPHSGTRPAAAHLARMVERGLLHRSGSLYVLSESTAPDLFP